MDQIRTTDALKVLLKLARATLDKLPPEDPENMIIEDAVDHIEKVVLCIKDGSTILKSVAVAECKKCQD